jgi:hypothetical protein
MCAQAGRDLERWWKDEEGLYFASAMNPRFRAPWNDWALTYSLEKEDPGSCVARTGPRMTGSVTQFWSTDLALHPMRLGVAWIPHHHWDWLQICVTSPSHEPHAAMAHSRMRKGRAQGWRWHSTWRSTGGWIIGGWQSTRRKREGGERACESHCSIAKAYFFLDLWMIMAISLLNVALQLSTVESSFLNNHGFLSFQILQYIIIMSSITNGIISCILMYFTALCGLNHDGAYTPIRSQQFFANGHLKKRCLSFSSFYSKQSSQEYHSRYLLFVLSSPLLFSLSWSKSQKKTLCFCWHDDLHNQRKEGCTFCEPKRCL